ASVGIPGAASAYEYFSTTGPLLANSAAASIALKSGSANLSEIVFGGFNFSLPTGGGASIQLKTLTVAASTSKASWCVATTAWSSGDKGTPGKANNCP
ncbi:MAG: Hemolysin-type calcium-binding region, partial [Myxococcaceae bacterium]|nr:Hemolysin-type calcium-binding region [Myxococcaceae bacterium]